MAEKEIVIPPFVQDYINKLDGDGFSDFVKISAEYQKEKDNYPGKYAEQSAHLNDHNRLTGQNRKLNYEDGLNRIDAEFRKKAYQTAKQHGYTGPDPNAPADKEFTKQGEKFNHMIDQAKERQQQQTQQNEQKQPPEEKQATVPADERKNIEALKEQQPYQQNKPKVEFKGIDVESSSGPEQQSREQQRTAFLEKVKATRDQQAQQQQSKQREI